MNDHDRPLTALDEMPTSAAEVKIVLESEARGTRRNALTPLLTIITSAAATTLGILVNFVTESLPNWPALAYLGVGLVAAIAAGTVIRFWQINPSETRVEYLQHFQPDSIDDSELRHLIVSLNNQQRDFENHLQKAPTTGKVS